jgi:tetratricopeptide (TPR) repeat protein
MNLSDINNLIQRTTVLAKTNWLQAVYLLQEGLKEEPDNYSLIINLGDIYLERQIYEKALSYYIKAISLHPDSPQLLFLIGTCYFSLGEYRIAISYFNRISNPPPEVLYNSALAYAFLGCYQESIDVINKILEVMDDNPFIYFLLIEQYVRMQNYDQAYQTIINAEKKFGKHRQLLLLSALVYGKKGIWLKSYHSFVEYESLGHITNPDHLIAYANAATNIGLIDRAIEILRQAQEINPYISVVYEELIRLLLQKNNYKEARKVLSLAKKYISQFSPVLYLFKERLDNHPPE